jgi:hypothetical protein
LVWDKTSRGSSLDELSRGGSVASCSGISGDVESGSIVMTDDNKKTVLTVTAEASANGDLDVFTHVDHTFSFEEVRVAMIKIRDELSRTIEVGFTQCPFRNHKGSK